MDNINGNGNNNNEPRRASERTLKRREQRRKKKQRDAKARAATKTSPPAAPPPAPAGPKKRFSPDEVDAMVKEMYGSNYHDLWEEAMMTMEIKTMTQLERQFPGIDWGRQSNMDMLDDDGEKAGNAYEAFRTYTRKALGRLTI